MNLSESPTENVRRTRGMNMSGLLGKEYQIYPENGFPRIDRFLSLVSRNIKQYIRYKRSQGMVRSGMKRPSRRYIVLVGIGIA